MARPKRETREDSARPLLSDDYKSLFFIDPKFLDKENYHYRWVETHCMNAETQSVSTAVYEGYEPIKMSDMPADEKTSAILKSIRGKDAMNDDYVRRGNQILMRCPIGIYNQLKKTERTESRRQTDRMDWAQQSGPIHAPTFVEVAHESRTYGKGFADDE